MQASAFVFGAVLCVACVCCGMAEAAGDETPTTRSASARPPSQPWFPKAPPLPPPTGEVVRVTTVGDLFKAAKQVKPGGTILVADGHYMMPRYFAITTDNVTLRGESGNRDTVILDGAKSRHGELVGITRCSGVTIADLTIQNIKWNGFKINSNTGVHRVTIHNCVIHNIWQRGIKGVGGMAKDGKRIPPRDCRIQYCLFYNDRPKRFSDDDAEAKNPNRFKGNYIGGMDIMNARSWIISDNVFVGIHGRTREARGAIFIWNGSEDCVIERNIIIDCDAGICLGNSHRNPKVWPIHCTGFIVRNNFVTRTPEAGILAVYTKDCRIVNNTMHHPRSRLRRLIRIVSDNDGLVVANNLLSGPRMRIQTQSKVTFRQNLEKDVTAFFVDAAAGNLHLKRALPDATDKAVPLPEVTEDIDRKPRGRAPDVGAHEFNPQTETHVEWRE